MVLGGFGVVVIVVVGVVVGGLVIGGCVGKPE